MQEAKIWEKAGNANDFQIVRFTLPSARLRSIGFLNASLKRKAMSLYGKFSWRYYIS